MDTGCDVVTFDDNPNGLFVVSDYAGNALQHDGTFGLRAKTFATVEDARAARPHDRVRILFKSQIRKFRSCGCLT